jgi:hypothetical protein
MVGESIVKRALSFTTKFVVAIFAATAVAFSGPGLAHATDHSVQISQTKIAPNVLPKPLIFIVAGSNVRMVSRESKVPVSVQNDYPVAMRVHIHARSINQSLVVTKSVSLIVPAESRKDALVPVTATSAGKFVLEVWLTTFTDLPLGTRTTINIDADPNFEILLLVGFGALILLLVVLGWRRMASLRKRRAIEARLADHKPESDS